MPYALGSTHALRFTHGLGSTHSERVVRPPLQRAANVDYECAGRERDVLLHHRHAISAFDTYGPGRLLNTSDLGE